MPCQEWQRRQSKMLKLLSLMDQLSVGEVTEQYKGTDYENLPMRLSALTAVKLDLDGDLTYSEEEIDDLIWQLEGKQPRSRRNLLFRDIKYSLPIPVHIDHLRYSVGDRNKIEGCLKIIQDNTCFQFKFFKRLRALEKYSSSIFYTYQNYRTTSPIGYEEGSHVNIPASQLDCGNVLKATLHTLGFYHEDARPDRDDYVDVRVDVVPIHRRSDYLKKASIAMTPYDYNSVTHHTCINARDSSKQIIYAKDTRFSKNLGQRFELSYYDIKDLNAFCYGFCKNIKTTKPCENWGYQNHYNCSICICPPGFYGDFCEKPVAEIENDKCGELKHLKADEEYEFSFSKETLDNPYKCEWYFTAPNGFVLELQFKGNFRVFGSENHPCVSYIEIKLSNYLDKPGPKACGLTLPTDKYITETNKMLIIMKQIIVNENIEPCMFTAVVRSFPSKTSITPVPVTERRLFPFKKGQEISFVTKADGYSTRKTTTTAKPITTTHKWQWYDRFRPSINQKSPDLVFFCDFEYDIQNKTCGMSQSQNDAFDWSVGQWKTKSYNTGPSMAFSGANYLYIESSCRNDNDNAQILVPPVKKGGMYCLRFWYSMFGKHINRLTVYVKTGNELVKSWEKSGNKGRRWFRGDFRGNLKANDRIVFEGVAMKNSPRGDIALDDISLSKCQ